MATVTLENITKRFDSVLAVRDFDLTIEDQEFVVIVGPSGCGKSTVLRMIAGLEEITSGTLRIDGRVVNDVPPKDRDIAMVFQNYALYPHMNVYQNMSFGLRLRKTPKHEIDQRVREAARILQIEELLGRRPRELSGGQRQRVALGRAIVRKPKVFLMDEPLSNLDAKLRVEMRASISKLHRDLGVTTVYVTHDQVEAMTMGSRIVVMKDGIMQQVDTPLNLYETPVNKFVGGFMGSPAMNFLRGVAQGGAIVGPSFHMTPDDALRSRLRTYEGEAMYFGIRPENLSIRDGSVELGQGNVIRASVRLVEPIGAATIIIAATGDDETIVARVEPHHNPPVDSTIELLAEPDAMQVFRGIDEHNIRFDDEPAHPPVPTLELRAGHV
jgi:multiple sugar transport system ATP-binding protein